MQVFSYSRLALVAGDLIVLMAAVPVTLTLRSFTFPSWSYLSLHLVPFIILALLSVAVYFSAGLYDRATALSDREMPAAILGAQIINIILAAFMFFFIPIFGITPRTNLGIYLAVSVTFVTIWRFLVRAFASASTAHAVIIGDGPDVELLHSECVHGRACPFGSATMVPVSGKNERELAADIGAALKKTPEFIVANPNDARLSPFMPQLFGSEQHGAPFIDFTDIYEKVFRKVPLSTLSYRSFLEERPAQFAYRLVKRVVDITLSTMLLMVLAVVTPFVALITRLESPGPIFICQDRIGKQWRPIRVFKFRTMTQHKAASGDWTVEEEHENKVTRFGALLRKLSIDEFPQIVSVFKGEMSLIGPRSDIAGLAERLKEAIPMYEARYSVLPGISGWAQVNQRYAPGNISPQSIEESRDRLAYDLYYVKHASPLLDLSIILRTAKTLIKRIV